MSRISLSLEQVPVRTTDEPLTALGSLSYPELVHLHERLAAQDPSIIFDTLRPVADEVWNLVDGRRDVASIVAALCLQFELDIDPTTLVPLLEGLAEKGHLTFAAPHGGQ